MKTIKEDGAQEAGVGGKRPRVNEEFTPSTDKGERGKNKMEGQDYSAVLSCLRVVVRNVDYPEGIIKEEVLENLQLDLMDKMAETTPEGKEFIAFRGFKVIEGAMVVNCANTRSKEWLEGVIKEITPFEGIQLETCDAISLEAYQDLL